MSLSSDPVDLLLFSASRAMLWAVRRRERERNEREREIGRRVEAERKGKIRKHLFTYSRQVWRTEDEQPQTPSSSPPSLPETPPTES